MYSGQGVAEILDLLMILWLGLLTYFFWKNRGFLKKLFPEKEDGEIKDKFEEILSFLEREKARDEVLNKNLRVLQRQGFGHLQRVSILRYNPYGDTGGNVSFSLAILDGLGNGVLITSLHTRAGTRVYAKDIVKGESSLKLSKEEAEVLAQAMKE